MAIKNAWKKFWHSENLVIETVSMDNHEAVLLSKTGSGTQKFAVNSGEFTMCCRHWLIYKQHNVEKINRQDVKKISQQKNKNIEIKSFIEYCQKFLPNSPVEEILVELISDETLLNEIEKRKQKEINEYNNF